MTNPSERLFDCSCSKDFCAVFLCFVFVLPSTTCAWSFRSLFLFLRLLFGLFFLSFFVCSRLFFFCFHWPRVVFCVGWEWFWGGCFFLVFVFVWSFSPRVRVVLCSFVSSCSLVSSIHSGLGLLCASFMTWLCNSCACFFELCSSVEDVSGLWVSAFTDAFLCCWFHLYSLNGPSDLLEFSFTLSCLTWHVIERHVLLEVSDLFPRLFPVLFQSLCLPSDYVQLHQFGCTFHWLIDPDVVWVWWCFLISWLVCVFGASPRSSAVCLQ
jgi:hypothetical protein